MKITRKRTLYDVAHGAEFNDSFADKGVQFYTKEDGINHSDKVENDETFWFDKTHPEDEDEWEGKKLYVKNLDVTNNEEVENNLTVDGNVHVIGKPGDDNTPALTVDNNTILKGQKDDNDEYVGDALTVEGTSTFKSPVQMDDKLHVDGETTIDNNLNVNGTTTITGDLHVKGTSYEEHATDLYVGADFVTLREGTSASLADGEKAGIIINKYDGDDSLGIITDNDGTLRIGEFNTVKVYTTDDTTYYSDRELKNEVEVPADKELYQIGETDPETNLKEYYYIDKDETEPVATRGSSGDMEDQHVTKWDANGKDIVTTAFTSNDVKNTINKADNLEQRVLDLENGKLFIDTSSKYPVEITSTPDDSYTELNSAPILTRITDKPITITIDGADVEVNQYKSAVSYFVKDGDDYDIVNNFYKDENGNIYIDHNSEITDTFTLYYLAGNTASTNYNVALNPDNVIRYFDTVEEFKSEMTASIDGTSDNPLEENNIVMIKNVFSFSDDVQKDIDLPTGAPLTIVDYVQSGNYNAVTSNAVQRAIGNVGEAMSDNVTIKVTDPIYSPLDIDAMLLYTNNYDAEGNILEGHEVYFFDTADSKYYASNSASVSGNEYTFYYNNTSVTASEGSVITYYTITTAGKMYAVIDSSFSSTSYLPVQNRVITSKLNSIDDAISDIQDVLPPELADGEELITTKSAFDVIYPVGSVYLSLSSSAPSTGEWTLRTRLDGPVDSNTNVYFWERIG